jgi:DNA-binding winged helix-turn-helix (wHTH) protein
VGDGIVTEPKSLVFKFGEFEVREEEFLLIKGGEPAPVEPKAFRVLLYLLRNPGRLVKKDEILNAVWEEVAVSENSLTRSIATLRRLLGDDAREPRYIATVQTIGYRFLCPVGVSEAEQDRADVSAQNVTDEQGPGELVRRRSGWIAGAVVATPLLVAVAWLGYRELKIHRGDSAGKASRSGPARIVQLTNLNGVVSWPAFSPDGKQIAFIWDAGEHPSRGDLYVQFIGGEAPPLRLTHTRSEYVNPPTWLPNGREVSFARCDDNGGAIYVVSALGGPEHRLTDVACPNGYFPPVSWTPRWKDSSDRGHVCFRRWAKHRGVFDGYRSEALSGWCFEGRGGCGLGPSDFAGWENSGICESAELRRRSLHRAGRRRFTYPIDDR